MPNVVQRALAGGELSPALYARTDLTKYATGARTVRNFLIRREGGLSNRPGFTFVGALKDSSRTARLVRFQFSADQTYVMEFGQGYIRWFRSGGRIVVDVPPAAWVTATVYRVGDMVQAAGVYYYCVAQHTSGASTEPGVGASWGGSWYAMVGTIYEIPTPYTEADLAALQFSQSADVVTIVHPGYAPRELRRYGHTKWTLTAVAFGPSVGQVTSLAATAGEAATSNATYAVTAVDEASGEEGLPVNVTYALRKGTTTTPIKLTWNALAGAVEFNVYRSDDGVAFGFIGVAGGIRSINTDTSWSTASSNVTTSTKDVWVEGGGQARNPVVATASQKASDGKYRVTGTYQVSATLAPDATIYVRARAYYSRDAEARVFAGDIFGASTPGGTSTGSIPWSGTVTVPDNGYTTLTIDIVPVMMIVAPASASATLTVTGTKIEWDTIGTGFNDDGITPDYSSAPPRDRTVFTAGGDYPGAVGSYQQRRLYGATLNQPERVWASKVALPANFLKMTPIADDDPVIWTLAGAKVNTVRHFLDMDGLFVLTSEQVYRIAGDADGVVTPTGVNPRALPFPGSSALTPLTVGTGAVYVESRGTVVRSLVNDVAGAMDGTDLTIFAAHLFSGKQIVAWDYAQLPHSIVWAVRSDGVLLGLTYLKEQEIWGWHRHDTDGAFEGCCVVSEGAEDVLYVIVRRTVNGATKRYIERMATRVVGDVRDGIFLDSALSYDGRNASDATLTLGGGTDWTDEETLTLTASAAVFDVDDIGNEFVLTEGGDSLRLRVVGYTDTAQVTVRAARTVPGPFRGLVTTAWARAVDGLGGLDHLEGRDVAVLADGMVVANPLDPDSPAFTVTGGVINLQAPAAVIHVGLPYISDLETLDIDTPQGPSLKDKRVLVNRVGLYVESSRGIWAGREAPTGTDATEGLQEYEPRDALADDRYDDPPPLITDWLSVQIPNEWDNRGAILVRQIDPLPLSILSVTPMGFLPVGG